MSSDIEQARQEIEQYREQVEFKNAVLRLVESKDFKTVIQDRFCTTDCARYVELSTSPQLKPENRQDALATAQAAGYLKRFLNVSIQMGNQAEEKILLVQQFITEMQQEASQQQGEG